MHAQAVRKYFARNDTGIFFKKSDDGFWSEAEKAVVSCLKVKAAEAGAPGYLATSQITNPATS